MQTRIALTALALTLISVCGLSSFSAGDPITLSDQTEANSPNTERLARIPRDPITSAVHLEADSLCEEGERVAFTARVEGSDKLVSICTSQDLEETRGYLQYRFGRPGRIELEFPSTRKETQKAFIYTRYTRPRVTLLTLKFRTEDYEYSIHQDFDAEQKPATEAAYLTVTPLDASGSDSKQVTIRVGVPVKGSLMQLESVVRNEPWSN